MRRRARRLQILCAAATLVATGCMRIPFTRGGTTHYLIIGIGVVSVSDPQQTAVVATDAHSLGVILSDRPGVKFAAGYSSASVVSVADGAEDVRVEVSRKVMGPLIVDTQRAKLRGNERGVNDAPERME
jgi:hypothetical protein